MVPVYMPEGMAPSVNTPPSSLGGKYIENKFAGIFPAWNKDGTKRVVLLIVEIEGNPIPTIPSKKSVA